MNSKTGEILADAELTMPGPGNTQPPAVPVSIAGAVRVGARDPAGPAGRGAVGQRLHPRLRAGVGQQAHHHLGRPRRPGSSSRPTSSPSRTATRWPDTTFHDAENHPTEHWTVTDVLANSSNIGTIQIAQRLGKDNLLKYIHAYGLGSITDIGFPGESAGLLPTYWSGTSIADVPIGQGIAVTAVQMLAAYNTIANGGVYVPPKLVDGIIDAKGREHLASVRPAPPGRLTDRGQGDDHHARRGGAGRHRQGRQPRALHGGRQDRNGAGALARRAATRADTTWPASPASFRPRTRRSPGWSWSTTPPTTARPRRLLRSRPSPATPCTTFDIQPLPPQPPAPGVPLATSAVGDRGRRDGRHAAARPGQPARRGARRPANASGAARGRQHHDRSSSHRHTASTTAPAPTADQPDAAPPRTVATAPAGQPDGPPRPRPRAPPPRRPMTAAGPEPAPRAAESVRLDGLLAEASLQELGLLETVVGDPDDRGAWP